MHRIPLITEVYNPGQGVISMTDSFRPSCPNVKCSGEETLVFLIQFCAVGGSWGVDHGG
jgi:hypothetical protein